MSGGCGRPSNVSLATTYRALAKTRRTQGDFQGARLALQSAWILNGRTVNRPQNIKFSNGAGKPVVALDIDGTLGDYHGHFLRFAEGYIGKPMPDAQEINPGLPLYRHMRVSRTTYRACKLAYRQGGLKRSMPVYDGAAELTRAVRRAGAEIWICTTRPYLRLDNIDPDTREWLRRNRIQYDAVLFGDNKRSNKYAELLRQVGRDRVVAVADDLPEQVIKAGKVGIRSLYLMDQPYNKYGVSLGAGYPFAPDRIHSLSELWHEIELQIRKYKREKRDV